MTVYLVMASVFASLTLVGYSLLDGSSRAWTQYSDNLARTTDSQLRRLFLFADTRRLLVLYLVALIGVPLALLLTGQSPALVLVAAVGLVIAPRVVFKRLAARRLDAINQALPDALAQISGAMKAGSTFTMAIQSMVEEQKGPIAQEFSVVLREQRLGARLDEALDNLGERVQSEEMDLVISAAMIAQEVGGNLSEILQRLSETIRRKLEMEGRIKALTAQGILQGRVVTMLPFLILGALMVIEPEATQPMFSSVLGWGFLSVIICLQAVGAVMIRKIVRIEI